MSHPFQRMLLVLLIASVFLAICTGCRPAPAPATTAAPTSAPTPVPAAPSGQPAYQDAMLPVEQRVADLLGRMTLAEKIGQMTQVEKNSIQPGDVTAYFIGSVLSGGDGQPKPNTPENWAAMVDAYQRAAAQTRLAIPLLYGVDAVHGMGALKGATIFPHAIGLGAAGDPDLVQRVARATAEQMVAVGIRWDFAPVVAVPQDIRWGRTYESFAENTALVSQLGAAYLRGLQEDDGQPALAGSSAVLATPKHYLGDGGTAFGSSTAIVMNVKYLLDQGDVRVDEATLRRLYLPPYKAAVDAGAMSIMISFSSFQGTKMHGNKYLVTDVLKGELGFQGFVVSDWQGIDQLPGDYHSDIVTAINAGLDMIMVPSDYKTFIAELTKAVQAGQVPQARVDDAVRRILAVKFRLGLFDRPAADPSLLAKIADDAKRALGREAVRKSLVLLKNEGAALPLRKDVPQILVAGAAADDTGMAAGGWSLSWQGAAGKEIPGTTLLAAVKQAVAAGTQVAFDAQGNFTDLSLSSRAPACLVAVGEMSYAEGVGDRADLALSSADRGLLERMRGQCDKLVVVLISGRPMIVTEQLGQMDALVAAWLPGSELLGITTALFGDQPFTGKLPYTWPRSMDQLPFDFAHLGSGDKGPLFPFGYGLDTAVPEKK
jgi:beta-glucosidase